MADFNALQGISGFNIVVLKQAPKLTKTDYVFAGITLYFPWRMMAHLRGHSVDRSGGENVDVWDCLIGDAEDAGGCHECEQGQEEIAVLTQGVEHVAAEEQEHILSGVSYLPKENIDLMWDLKTIHDLTPGNY